MQFSTAFLQSFFVSSRVCVFFPVFSANFRTCDILRIHAMCHIKDSHSFSCTLCTHTHRHAHKRTNTNRRCELCCLLSPGLVHTRIPLAGATSRSPQSTTHTHRASALCSFPLPCSHFACRSLLLSPCSPQLSSSSPNPIPTHSRRFTRAPCHSSGGNRQQLLGIIAQQQRRAAEGRRGERVAAVVRQRVWESGS